MEGEGPRAGSLEVLAEKAEVTEAAATEEAMAAVAKVVAKVVATVEAAKAVAKVVAKVVVVKAVATVVVERVAARGVAAKVVAVTGVAVKAVVRAVRGDRNRTEYRSRSNLCLHCTPSTLSRRRRRHIRRAHHRPPARP